VIITRTADLEHLPRIQLLVIGAGATGLTLARLVRQSTPGIGILVVEQGGASTQRISAPPADRGAGGLHGMGIGVGGSAGLWAGQAMRFGELDFRPRPWVNDSGWPISRQDLLPHYRRAEKLLGVGDLLTPPAQGLPHGLEEHTSAFAPEREISKGWRKEYRSDRHHNIALGIKAAGVLRTDERITSVTLVDAAGTCVDLAADVVVLAAGTIENTRLLLQPTATDPAGVAGCNSWVGSRFQDHPNGRVATIIGPSAGSIRQRFGPRSSAQVRCLPKLALDDAAQAEERVPGVGCVFTYDYPDGELAGELRTIEALIHGRDYVGASVSAVRAALRRPALTARLAVSPKARRRYADAPAAVGVHLFGEPEPSSADTLTLSPEKDSFGLPKVDISWRISEGVRRSMRRFLDHLAQLVAAEEWGRLAVDPRFGDERWTTLLEDNKHHAGTARMSVSAHHGVVDPSCRVHGLRNLYVTGGAVFPTASWMNPTLTMLALASRLADHLAEDMR
jgi:choline dehydrogenase-like flavoprotein